MPKAKVVFFCLLIMFIDITAGILGIQAEIAQSKGKPSIINFVECREPVHEAYRLGVAAAALLALAHVIGNFIGGCICWSSNAWYSALTLALSWIILVVGFMMLISGAIPNSKSNINCEWSIQRYSLHNGGILCFAHGVLIVAYCVSAISEEKAESEGMEMFEI